MLTVQQIADFIDARAPFATQLDFDNCGLLVGDPAAEVRGVHAALDCTDAVIDEAIAAGANVIVTHHPVIFSGRKHLREDDPEARMLCRLIRGRIAVISAHTCLDAAPGGVNDVLAERLGLVNVSGEGFLRVGDLPKPLPAAEAAARIGAQLGDTVRLMGDPARTVSRIGLCSGSGSEYWQDARALGADAFLSGEIRHHHALSAVAAGMVCFECGHHATEEPGIFALADALQNWDDVVKCNVCVTKSQVSAYMRSL